MRIVAFILALLFSLQGIGMAADVNDLSPFLEGLFLSSMMQDWQQTTKFLRQPPTATPLPGGGTYVQPPMKEENPLLGDHPSQSKMTALGALATAAQVAGYQKIPDPYKLPFVLSTAIPEMLVVNHNRQQGLKLDPKAALLGAALTGALAYQHFNNKGEQDFQVSPGMVGDTFGMNLNFRW